MPIALQRLLRRTVADTSCSQTRSGKSNSMTSSWVAIDFETANSFRGSPCSVGMIEVEQGRTCRSWGTLIQPPADYSHFDGYNIAIHGISPSDVTDAPSWAEALAGITRFADGRPIVAHNAGFDFGVIRAACTAEDIPWPEIRFACSQVVARRTWRLLSYRLPFCADAAGFALSNHHDAVSDADASARVMLAAVSRAGVATLDDLLKGLRIGWGQMSPAGTWLGSRHKGTSGGGGTRAPMPDANTDADPDGPLFGLTVCLTGQLSSMTRAEAHTRLAAAGAQPVSNVSGKTDVLVSATQTSLLPGSTMSGKETKAQQLLESGHDIEVIDETELLQRLSS
jgi:DNA polymerase III epsilon subunit-like protein